MHGEGLQNTAVEPIELRLYYNSKPHEKTHWSTDRSLLPLDAKTSITSDLFLAAGRDEVDVSGLVRQREGHH